MSGVSLVVPDSWTVESRTPPTLNARDRNRTGPAVIARAKALFSHWHSWESYAKFAERTAGVLPTHDEAARKESFFREYLVEYVEYHNLNYSRYDPRNIKPGIAEEPPEGDDE